MIRKLRGKRLWRLFSRKSGRNLGTFATRAGAVRHEREVQFFKNR